MHIEDAEELETARITMQKPFTTTADNTKARELPRQLIARARNHENYHAILSATSDLIARCLRDCD